ncbi:hypothetical protein D3C85_1079050 [compost metagenome]
MNLIRALLYTIVIINTYGCAGIYFSSTHTTDVRELPKNEMAYLGINQAKQDHPISGEQIYNKEIEWCGLTIWAIIPIPLLLPVCSSQTKVNFANGKPISSSQKFVKGSGFLCGPPMSLVNTFDGGDSSFCSSF